MAQPFRKQPWYVVHETFLKAFRNAWVVWHRNKRSQRPGKTLSDEVFRAWAAIPGPRADPFQKLPDLSQMIAGFDGPEGFDSLSYMWSCCLDCFSFFSLGSLFPTELRMEFEQIVKESSLYACGQTGGWDPQDVYVQFHVDDADRLAKWTSASENFYESFRMENDYKSAFAVCKFNWLYFMATGDFLLQYLDAGNEAAIEQQSEALSAGHFAMPWMASPAIYRPLKRKHTVPEPDFDMFFADVFADAANRQEIRANLERAGYLPL